MNYFYFSGNPKKKKAKVAGRGGEQGGGVVHLSFGGHLALCDSVRIMLRTAVYSVVGVVLRTILRTIHQSTLKIL